HAVAQLPELEGGRVLGGGFVLDRVTQIHQRLQQPVHVALAQLEHDGQLAHSQRALTARQCFHHLQTFDQCVVHGAASLVWPGIMVVALRSTSRARVPRRMSSVYWPAPRSRASSSGRRAEWLLPRGASNFSKSVEVMGLTS